MKRTLLTLTFTAGILAGCSTAPIDVPPEPVAVVPAEAAAPAPAADDRFDTLAEEYYEAYLRLNPIVASSIGDDRYNDQFPVTISREHREARGEMARQYLGLLASIDRSALDGQRQLSYDMLAGTLRQELEELTFPSHLIPVNQFYNTAALFAQLGSGSSIHPFRTVKDYDDFLGRIGGFEKWVDAAIANMREGVSKGIVQPRILIERTIPQLDALIVDEVEKSLFYRPIENMPGTINAEEKARITAAYMEAISSRLHPAYRKLRDFIKNEYLPKSRSTVGMAHLPGGREWYESLKSSTPRPWR